MGVTIEDGGGEGGGQGAKRSQEKGIATRGRDALEFPPVPSGMRAHVSQ